MLVRLACIAVTHAFTALRLIPMSDHDKDVEILALRHQLAVLQRRLGNQRPGFQAADRAFPAALLAPLPQAALRQLRLIVSPDTVLRWHRDFMNNRHVRLSRNRRPGHPRTVTSVRRLILRLAEENPTWGYRRIHGELALLGIKLAPSTVWEILKAEGVDPATQRSNVTWATFLHSQAEAILTMDFI
ncbi:helix-turn-helix domain-containing protein [Streptomyces sp. AcE210]|uniref:helix-turn-helix domain-containing protein n=1 Tax=Streptomyces sp. AcE210 TaxID=2292703 RepID=UPI0026B79299